MDSKITNEKLNDVLFNSISYFDYDEKFYHGMLEEMLSDYQIVSNQESGLRRLDIALLPIYNKKETWCLN